MLLALFVLRLLLFFVKSLFEKLYYFILARIIFILKHVRVIFQQSACSAFDYLVAVEPRTILHNELVILYLLEHFVGNRVQRLFGFISIDSLFVLNLVCDQLARTNLLLLLLITENRINLLNLI